MSKLKKVFQKIENTVNAGLKKVGGTNIEGDGRWWIHLAPEGKAKLGRQIGNLRGWLHTPYRVSPYFELSFRRKLVDGALGFELDGSESALRFRVAAGPVALYYGVEHLHRLFKTLESTKKLACDDRNIEIYIFDDRPDDILFNPMIHWRLWTSSNEWTSKTPKWREGSVRPMEKLFGRCCVQERKVLEERDTVIPMPEGPYKATAKLDEYKFGFKKLKRFWYTGRSVNMDFDPPIPHSRKGSLHGISLRADSINEAVGKVVADCFQYVNLEHLEPHPDAQRQRLEERRKKTHYANCRRGEKWALVEELKKQKGLELRAKDIEKSEYLEEHGNVVVWLVDGSSFTLTNIPPAEDEVRKKQDAEARAMGCNTVREV